jgi:xylulokinase
MNPSLMWTVIISSISQCIQRAKIDPNDIGGLSVSSFVETVIPVGREGRHVHPAIDWNDTRSEGYKTEIDLLDKKIGRSTLFEITGYPLNHIPSIIKILWLKENMKCTRRRGSSCLWRTL